jgi:hypothetical protein
MVCSIYITAPINFNDRDFQESNVDQYAAESYQFWAPILYCHITKYSPSLWIADTG